MGRNILITGTLGFLGFNLARLLAENFPMYNVVGIDNEKDQKYINHKEILENLPNFWYIKGDVLNKKLIREIFLLNHTALSNLSEIHGIDIVYTTAFESLLHDISTDGLEYYQNNLLGPLNIAIEYILAKNEHKRFVYTSSCYVYGFSDDDKPFDESYPTKPLSKNASIKLSVEQLLRSIHMNFGLPITILRIPSLYGYGLKGDHLLMNIINAVLNDEQISVDFSDKTCVNAILFEDLLVGYERLISFNSKGYDIFNMGGVNIMLRDFYMQVKEVFYKLTGERRRDDLVIFKNKIDKNCCISSDYAYKVLGWKNWTEVYWGLEKTLKAMLDDKKTS
ncbi:MAG: NAD(P)-dependent oxidoreductase [Calditerrivibrio sp.]|nr:NAD(P)-dependent oxidoreductase [Calditerrivibrio sp.]